MHVMETDTKSLQYGSSCQCRGSCEGGLPGGLLYMYVKGTDTGHRRTIHPAIIYYICR
jgi:hypothetical protein